MHQYRTWNCKLLLGLLLLSGAVNGLAEQEAAIRDLAITRLRAPKTIRFATDSGFATARVFVTVQNRGNRTEIFTSSNEISELVSLQISPLNTTCPSAYNEIILSPTRKFPMVLRPRQAFRLAYNVTLSCVVDPAAGAGHADYSFAAVIRPRPGLDDAHPECDTCPRPPAAERVDVTTGRRFRDRGCGSRQARGVLGGQILTDLVVKGSQLLAQPDFIAATNGGLLSGFGSLMANDVDTESSPLRLHSIDAVSENGGTILWPKDGEVALVREFAEHADQIGRVVCKDPSGNLYMAGSAEREANGFVIKYNPVGKATWTNHIPVSIVSATVDSQGGLHLLGKNNAIFKFSTTGMLLWTNSFHSPPDQGFGDKILADAEGNSYVIGSTFAGESTRYAVVTSYDRAGVPRWTNQWANALVGDGMATTMSGTFLIVAHISAPPLRLTTAKLDLSGALLWKKDVLIRHAEDIRASSDMAGNVYSATADTIVKYSPNGIPLWTNVNQCADYDGQERIAVAAADGSVFGANECDNNVMKFSTNSELLWSVPLNLPGPFVGPLTRITTDPTGHVYAAGNIFFDPDVNFRIYKLSSTGSTLWTNILPIYIEGKYGPDVIVDHFGNTFITGITPEERAVLIKISGGNEFVYTAPINFTGMDTFKYVIENGRGQLSTGTVSVAVNADAKRQSLGRGL